jgi:hypothetical protein
LADLAGSVLRVSATVVEKEADVMGSEYFEQALVLRSFDGASFIIGTSGPRDFKGLAGKKVGVLVNTTTEANLKRSLQEASINAEVISVKNARTLRRQR